MADNSGYVTLTDQNFKSEVLEAGRPVLVDFWAQWCAPCRAVAPAIEELAHDFEGKATVAKLDVDAHPQLSAQFGIRGIPAFLLFKDGEVVDQISGLVSKEELASRLQKLLPAA